VTSTGSQRATLHDVARAAGVSVSTVSKVMNGRRDVGPEVRQRVTDTIDQLGYRPNAMARGLRTRRSDSIALISDDLEGIFTSSLMRGVENAAFRAHVSVILCNSYGQRSLEEMHLKRLVDKRVDGLIFVSGNRVGARAEPAAELPEDLPRLFLYEYSTDPAATSILPDDAGGAGLAVAHLVGSGYERIAFLNGPEQWEATADRLAGFRSALQSHGRHADDRLIAHSDSWSPEEAYTITSSLIARESFDAIFCASDELAMGAVAALRDAGLDVPTDVGVVGFDDRAFAAHQRPPLSTVALPLVEMGEMAGSMLLNAIEGIPLRSGTFRVPCSLRVRASSARPGELP
jgi:LacI family transcriptional regulator